MSVRVDNPFFLAPMAGITDVAFRRLMKSMGAGCVISEFVSAHAIVRNVPRIWKQYLVFHKDEGDMGIQIFGDEAEILAQAAKIVEDLGVSFVDINLGCPVNKVTKKGGGSAWLTDVNELAKMLRKVKAAISIPLTIKIRTGWDDSSINAQEVIDMAKNEGIHWVAVHGRTRAQGYSGAADWNYMQGLCEQSSLPIICNGDIISGAQAAAYYLKTSSSGIMIGRGALKNPWIFFEAQEALAILQAMPQDERKVVVDNIVGHFQNRYLATQGDGSQSKPVDKSAALIKIRADRKPMELIAKHTEFLQETYPEERVKFCLRKFLAWYAAGYPGAHEFRKFIYTHEDFDQIIQRTEDFFKDIQALSSSKDLLRDAAPVLMSGHG